ncbi:MAG: DUF4962 domain-containing protein [Bacteroidota bacterium]
MKDRKFFIVLMVMQLALLQSVQIFAQTVGDYRSHQSGNWNATSSWDKYTGTAWVTATTAPTATTNIDILSGHTITLNVSGSCSRLFVESGGVFTTASALTLTVRGDSIKNNGTITSSGADGMILSISNVASGMIITGTGTCTLGRIRALGNNLNNLKLTIDQNINLLTTGTTALSLYYNDGTNTPVATDSLTLNINAGKTVKFMGNGAFHSSSGGTTVAAGRYVYNINGTLDLSISTATSYVVPNSVTAASRIYVNVGGVLKLPKGLNGVNSSPSGHDGKVAFNINTGGLVDATATTSIALGTNYFVTNGTGALKRTVGSSNITFPIGTSTGLATVVLVNSKTASNFLVSVKNTFDHAVPDSNKVVNRQWNIVQDGYGAEVNVAFSWPTTQQGPSFSLSGNLSIINYDSGSWKETFAGVAVDTISSPHIATAKANQTFTSFGLFTVENGSILLNNGPTATQIMTDFNTRNPHNEHPRLFVHANDFTAFKAKIDSFPILDSIKIRIKFMADSVRPLLVLTSTLYNLETARSALTRIWALSQTYKFTGDTAYAERARKEMIAIAGFPAWKDPSSSPTFDLAMSEMLTAMAFGYDWCYDYLSSTDRSTIETAMKNKALSFGLTCYQHPGTPGSGWVTAVGDNWSLVCNSGLAIGALALADSYTDAGQILAYGLQYLQFPLKALSVDGSWPEGITYWRYGMDYYAKYITCLQSALGSEYGYCDSLSYIHKSGYFPIDEFGSIGYNFRDAGAPTDNAKLLYMFFANRFNDPVLANYRYAQIKNHAYNKGAFEDLVWWKTPLINTALPYATGEDYLNTTMLAKDNRYTNIEAITFRKDWREESSFVGFHNGKINGSHTHLDAGSFVYDAMGIRWANDLGPDNYSIPNYRFDAYKTRAEGHNTLTINPSPAGDQDINATAPITTYLPGSDISCAVADLTQVYRYKGATDVRRGVALMENKRTCLVQDEFALTNPSDLYWFMHMPFNSVFEFAAGNRSVKVTKSGTGKSIYVKLLKPAGAIFTLMADTAFAGPLSPHPVQGGSTSRQKLTIHLPTALKDTIAVYIAPLDSITRDTGDVVSPTLIPLIDWGTSEALMTPALQKSSLKVSNNNGKVDLLWNAVNSAKSSFIVQRSNGIGFVTIGQAKGNPSGTITFTDQKPMMNITSYYRIQQVNKRKAMYSDTGAVKLNVKPEDDFLLYPNPASSSVTLRLKTTNQNLKLVVVGLYGKSILSVSGTLEYINQQLNLKMPGLAPGMYMLNLVDADKKYARQLIKQ